ncbi:Uncharacterised protein [Vibrio cholerae]|nr:Uncharacterised protein [Vibrio cholerae]
MSYRIVTTESGQRLRHVHHKVRIYDRHLWCQFVVCQWVLSASLVVSHNREWCNF